MRPTNKKIPDLDTTRTHALIWSLTSSCCSPLDRDQNSISDGKWKCAFLREPLRYPGLPAPATKLTASYVSALPRHTAHHSCIPCRSAEWCAAIA
jgi:hypothetical protein